MKKLFMLTLILVFLLGLLPATQAQDNVEITFVHIFPDERDIRRTTIQEIADAFMAANPNVTINIQSTTDLYEEVFDGAIRAAEQGDAPHIIQIEDSYYQLAIDSQFFVKISDYASEEQLASLSDILLPIRNYYNLDEEVWGLPWNASNPLLFINPDMFTAAGLDPADPPQTFDEILAACEAIMSANIEGLQACANWTVTSWLPEQWLSMQNILFLNNDNGRTGRATETLLTQEPMLNIFNWWKEMSDRGFFTYTGIPNAYTPEGLSFVTKKTAIHITTSAGLSNILSFGQTLGQFTAVVAPLPLPNETATNGVTVGGGAVWVTNGHPDAEIQAAVDFAFFLTQTENDMKWHQASGYFPIRQTSIDQLTEAGWFTEHPEFRIALDQLLTITESNPANAGSLLGAYPTVRQIVTEAIQSVIDGGEDPAEVLAVAKERADAAIQEYNDIMGE